MPIYELDGQAPEFPGEGQYYVADTAVLIGRVRLKAEASVWFGAVLRGDNEWIELGERSQIQDNSTLHSDPGFPMTIGRDCVIGHNVILHGCTIGDSSLVGMGAIIPSPRLMQYQGFIPFLTTAPWLFFPRSLLQMIACVTARSVEVLC